MKWKSMLSRELGRRRWRQTETIRQGQCRLCGAPANLPTGVHILRHTFCSHLVMRGAAMRAVQELVGHQDLTMTQQYSHLSPAALIDTVR